MNKNIPFTLIALLTVILSHSQDLQKIKGSRNVITEVKEVAAFHKIALDSDFNVSILQGLVPSVEIEADDNLFDSISFTVTEGVLKFEKLQDVKSSKKFNITIIYKEGLTEVELNDQAQIRSKSKLLLNDFTLTAKGKTKAVLMIDKANSIHLFQDEKSKVNFDLSSKEITAQLNGSSFMEGKISVDTFNLEMANDTDAVIKGSSKKASLKLRNSSNLEADGFISNDCSLIIKGKSFASVEVSNTFTLQAYNTTKTHLYNTPKIYLEKFKDEAILFKK